MKQKKIFLCCSGIDDVLSGSPKVAGIQVQMSFWAQSFSKQGWEVISFSNKENLPVFDGIRFVRKTKSKWLSRLHLEMIQEFLDCKKCIKTKPDLIIDRGASRSLFPLSMLCRRKKIPLIHFGASDTDFTPGKELVRGSSLNRKLYQKALGKINYFVTQNSEQQDSLLKNYGKKSLVLPNIWVTSKECVSEKRYDAVWIANLRPLKRVEWFVDLAKQLPIYRFAIVGGALDKEYYDRVRQSASGIDNLSFLGAKSFEEVNNLLAQSRLLVCTSEFEGFPNTFLQAWASNVPVVSTVNPNNCITEFGLGRVISEVSQLQLAVDDLLNSDELYGRCQQNIKDYFTAHHNAETAYQKVIKFISEE